MHDFQKPNIFISKCLGFDNCRYNGQMINDDFVENLKPFVNIINACPEMSIGLEVPRDPIRVVSENNEFKLYQPKTEKEFTKERNDFADSYLNSLNYIDGFLKYQMKKLTISTPMLLVKSYIVRFNITYLLEQTYFNPYPEDLIMLEDSEKI